MVGVVSVPVFFWPIGSIPSELWRVSLMWRWAEVLIVGVGLYGWLGGSVRSLDMKLLCLLGGLLAIAGAASVLGVNMEKSLWGNYYRRDGLYSLLHLAGLALAVGLMWRDTWRGVLVQAISFGAGIVSLLAVLDGWRYFGWGDTSVSGWGGALGSTFGQPNFLAGYLLVCLPLAWYGLHTARRWKWVWGGLLGLQAAAIGLTQSLTGGVGLLVLLGLWGVSRAPSHKGRVVISGGVMIALLLAGGVWFASRQAQGYVPEGRLRIYHNVAVGGWQRPWLGWGVANVDYAFRAVEWPYHIPEDIYLDKAHSVLLEWWATTGVVGLGVYILLLFRLGQLIYRRARVGAADRRLWWRVLGVVLLMHVLHANTNVTSVAQEVVFWLVVGVGLSVAEA